MRKIYFYGCLGVLFISTSCNLDDQFSENKVSNNSLLEKKYNVENNMLVFSGKKSEIKDFVYGSKASLLEESYKKGFIPMMVSSCNKKD